jgi:hypothetical protein
MTVALKFDPVSGTGIATFATAALLAGAHTITADYSGDSAFLPSGGSTTQIVKAAMQRVATAIVVGSAPDPSTVGQPVSFTATVTKAAGATGTPTGTVTFQEGSAVLGTAPLDAAGRAIFTTTALGVGSHTVAAVYSGDANFVTSIGTTVQVVNTVPVTGKAPRVMNLQRFGIHAQPTVLVLTFDRPLDPATAQDARNYRITDACGHPIGLLSVAYDPAAQAVTLFPSRRLNIHRQYHLTVIGTGSTGVRGADGKLLDGAGTGQSGSNYEAVINRATLVLPPTVSHLTGHPHGPLAARHNAPSTRSTHTVDFA